MSTADDPAGGGKRTEPGGESGRESSKPFTQSARRWIRAAVVENFAIKFVAFVLAVTVFILVNTGQDVVIGAYVGVSYTPPEGRILVSEPVDQVRISMRGSWRRTKRFDERELERIHIDLRKRQDGDFQFQEDMVRLPHGLEILSITPRSVHLEFENITSKSVPVKVVTVGQPAPGFKVGLSAASPAQVTVRGAESVVAKLKQVKTLSISLDGRNGTIRESVALVDPGKYVSIVGKTQADVTIALAEALERKVIGSLKVDVRDADGAEVPVGRFIVEPVEVTVVLHGSSLAIAAATQAELVPYIKIVGDDVTTERTAEVLVNVEGVGHEVKPREVRVRRVIP